MRAKAVGDLLGRRDVVFDDKDLGQEAGLCAGASLATVRRRRPRQGFVSILNIGLLLAVP
jgi:hypothetical protein